MTPRSPNWFAAQEGETFAERRAIGGELAQTLRYGENPHQKAAFYSDGSKRPGVATATQVQGKELSYNNINDTDAAYELRRRVRRIGRSSSSSTPIPAAWPRPDLFKPTRKRWPAIPSRPSAASSR
jgi:hypothetical protein